MMAGLIFMPILTLILIVLVLLFVIDTIKTGKSTEENPLFLRIIILVFGISAIISGLLVSINLFSEYLSECPRCNTQRKTNDYCITCGYNFNQEKICPNCKKNTDNSSIYCGHCGSYILK